MAQLCQKLDEIQDLNTRVLIITFGTLPAAQAWLIFLIGYLPFFLVSFWVFDMPTLRQKAITVGVIFSVVIASLLVFGAVLGWI